MPNSVNSYKAELQGEMQSQLITDDSLVHVTSFKKCTEWVTRLT